MLFAKWMLFVLCEITVTETASLRLPCLTATPNWCLRQLERQQFLTWYQPPRCSSLSQATRRAAEGVPPSPTREDTGGFREDTRVADAVAADPRRRVSVKRREQPGSAPGDRRR